MVEIRTRISRFVAGWKSFTYALGRVNTAMGLLTVNGLGLEELIVIWNGTIG